jgi:heme oxygenase (mycobilin-producing)
MIVVTNRIPVAPGWEEKFEERFRQRAHLVDRSPGFVRNEVHRPKPMKLDRDSGGWVEDPEREVYYEVKTWWRSFEDFVAWTKSESFREAHRDRPPKEMFAGQNMLEIHEVFLSTDRAADADDDAG